MNDDTEGLHPIANTNDDSRVADVIFVHGLGGSSHSTWRYGMATDVDHFFWPQELAKDVRCGIWSLGYPAGLTALGEPGMIIQLRAGNLSQKLVNARLGNRPIIFIAHSMGGLIVKSLIVGSKTLGDQDRKKIAGAVKGVVFCATPHRGSDFTNAAKIMGLFLGGAQAHLLQLETSSQELNILHDEFIEWHRESRIEVCSYAENIALMKRRSWFRPLPLGKVVTRDSANPNIAGHVVKDVDDDHLTIVKPRNRSHDVYAGTLRFIEEIIAKSKSRSPIKSILIADDHPMVIEMLEIIINRIWPSIKIITAKDGIETLEKISSENPDLLMLDLQMPRATGQEVLASLASQDSALPVFIYSGSQAVHMEPKVKMLYSNLAGYIEKTASPKSIILMVKNFIDQTAANDSK